eukprot:TRINITY_DN3135_c0_g1_i1.p1 TRINITY_DN3135_c0_g1~~TRINITY_DN3135_c0_g1_i1.p1  ORF type:complete len:734 (+),score=167.77 TRINITY_DN3135_c0_g1_i1:43-2244(+)
MARKRAAVGLLLAAVGLCAWQEWRPSHGELPRWRASPRRGGWTLQLSASVGDTRPRPERTVTLQTLYNRRVLLPHDKQYALAARLLGATPDETYTKHWAKMLAGHRWAGEQLTWGAYVKVPKTCTVDMGYNLAHGWSAGVTKPGRKWTFVRDPIQRFVAGYSQILEQFNNTKKESNKFFKLKCPSPVHAVDKRPFDHTRSKGKYLADIETSKATDPLFIRHDPESEESAKRFIEDVATGEVTKMYKLFPECVPLVSHVHPMEDLTARERGLNFVGKVETFEADLAKLAAWGGIHKGPKDFVRKNEKRVRMGTAAMTEVLRNSPAHLLAVCALTFNDLLRFQYELPEACHGIGVAWDGWERAEATPVLDCEGDFCKLARRLAGQELAVPGLAAPLPLAELDGAVESPPVSLQILYDRRVLLPQDRQYALAAAVLGTKPVEPYAAAWAKAAFHNTWTEQPASYGAYVRVYKCGNSDLTNNVQKHGWGETSVRQPQRRWTFVRDPIKRFVSGYSEILERFAKAQREGNNWHKYKCMSAVGVDPVSKQAFDSTRTKAKYLADVAKVRATDPLFIRHDPESEESAKRFIEDVATGEVTKMHKLFPECLDLVNHIHPMEDTATHKKGLDFVGKLESFESDLAKLAAWGGIPKDSTDFVRKKGRDGNRVRMGTAAMTEVLRNSPAHLLAVCALTFNDLLRFQYELPEACRKVTVKWAGWEKVNAVKVLGCSGGVCALPRR